MEGSHSLLLIGSTFNTKIIQFFTSHCMLNTFKKSSLKDNIMNFEHRTKWTMSCEHLDWPGVCHVANDDVCLVMACLDLIKHWVRQF